MAYHFATDRRNYRDLASGAVLHSAPGFPAFPVRLASEAFLAALDVLGSSRPATVWDPCCGSGYLLTVLGLLHRDRITAVLASDIDAAAVTLARKNLELLSLPGIRERAADLVMMAQRHGRPSHTQFAKSAYQLEQMLIDGGGGLPHRAVQADAFDIDQVRTVLDHDRPTIVITDIPYGEQSVWQGPRRSLGVPGLLRSITSTLPVDSIVVLTARGRRVDVGQGTRTLARFKIGTRAGVLLRAGDVRDSIQEDNYV